MAILSDPDIEARVRRIEAETGKPVVLRPVRAGCDCVRGRVIERASCFLVEYRDEMPGYFWHHDLIRELLACIEQHRGRRVTLYEGDVQYVEVPLPRTSRRSRPSRPPGNP